MVRISDNGCRIPGLLSIYIVLSVSVLIFAVFHTCHHWADMGLQCHKCFEHDDDLLGI